MIHEHKLRVSSNGNTSENTPSKFAREIDILQSLKHPNVCGLKEVFFQDGNISPYCMSYLRGSTLIKSFADLVLEYISGGDLLDYILKKNGLSKFLLFTTVINGANVNSSGT